MTVLQLQDTVHASLASQSQCWIVEEDLALMLQSHPHLSGGKNPLTTMAFTSEKTRIGSGFK